MKNSAQYTTKCERAAARIQYWIGSEKEHFLKSSPKISNRRRAFVLVRTPHIPPKKLSFSLHHQRHPKKNLPSHSITVENSSKNLQLSLEPTQCSVNQRYPHFGSKLSSERIIHLKEHLFVSKKLKLLAEQTSTGPKRHEIVPILSSSTEHTPREEWKIPNERQYQFDRVIKYLTEI